VSAEPERDRSADGAIGERRWPTAAAVLVAMSLPFLMPEGFFDGLLFWVVPIAEGILLLVLIAADPGRINRRSRPLRILSILLLGVLVAAGLFGTVSLVDDLIHGGVETQAAGPLLAAGSLVLLGNVIAFSFVFWELDAGGPAVRAHRAPDHPDFAFPQQLQPAISPVGWRPQFIDYLYLSTTNTFALSPTDVMPLAPWAKIAMAVQSVSSLLIIGLVLARAVNVLA
jgi:hypothetical protein